MKTLTLHEVARYLGVSDSTIRKIVPELPGAVKINRRVRYQEEAIQRFVQSGGCRGETAKPAVSPQP
jgi:excisionase family DNA binding protein